MLCCRLEDGDFPLLSNSRTFPHLIVSLSELKALAFNDEQEKVVNKVGHGIILKKTCLLKEDKRNYELIIYKYILSCNIY